VTISSGAAKTILTNLGFRVNTSTRYRQALRDFQAGWNLGPYLGIDGVLGSKTSSALALSESRRRAGKGTLSANFSFKEFQCHCGGRYSSCRRIRGEGTSKRHTLRALVQSLEVLRKEEYHHGFSIVSGYRCPSHNKSVGGASSSQHMYGSAADIAPVVSTNEVRNLHKFAGIGFQGSSGRVRHVDRRDFSGVNPTNGRITAPTIWRYS
jgi:zinc D-Ala-D-Ala carboxypeptidase